VRDNNFDKAMTGFQESPPSARARSPPQCALGSSRAHRAERGGQPVTGPVSFPRNGDSLDGEPAVVKLPDETPDAPDDTSTSEVTPGA
jgi:hypothetical protein